MRQAKETADEVAAEEVTVTARSKEASDRTVHGWPANQAAAVKTTVEVTMADTTAHETDKPELSLTTAWDGDAAFQQ